VCTAAATYRRNEPEKSKCSLAHASEPNALTITLNDAICTNASVAGNAVLISNADVYAYSLCADRNVPLFKLARDDESIYETIRPKVIIQLYVWPADEPGYGNALI
jgi:hypothetical protein